MNGERERGTDLLDQTQVGGTNGARVPFAGRQREIDLLHAALDRASEGHGRLVLLSGGRGIGKTRTASEFSRQAKHRGFAVLWARCPEGQGAPRFGPWVQILEQCVYGLDESSLRDLLSSAVPELAQVVPAIRDRMRDGSVGCEGRSSTPFDFFDNVVRLLAEVARRTPQVVVLDDLQGADPTSLLFLQFLARHLDDLPLLVVAASCEDGLRNGHPLFDALMELERAPATERLDLHGLTPDDLGQLVAARSVAELPNQVVAALWQCTEGNPFFVLELLQALGAEGLRDLPENGLRIVPVMPEVRTLVSGRLVSLSDACRRALRIAATIGYHFPAALVAAVVAEGADEGEHPIAASRGRDTEAIVAFLEEGIVVRVVRPLPEAPGCYRFSDWFTMNVLRQEVSVAHRASLHRRIAQVLDRENAAIPCLTEWAELDEVSAANGADTVCMRYCEHASLFAGLRPHFAEPDAEEAPAVLTTDPRRSGMLRKEGDYWTVRFGSVAEQLKESRGLVYLSHLLRHPRRPFLAVELVELSPGAGRSDSSSEVPEPSAVRRAFSTSVEPMMDAKARAACRERIAELREELAEAESRNDLGQMERLRDEVEELLSLWRGSVGLGGRARPVSSSVMERARSAVTKRIRAEIVRIAAVNAELGDHLAATIVTGQVCSYQPDCDAAVTWDL